MERFGVKIKYKRVPELDPDFLPLEQFNRAFLRTAQKPVSMALERSDGQIAVYHSRIHGTPEMADADHYFLNRLVKVLLWMKGGNRIYFSGDPDSLPVFQRIQADFNTDGCQTFDRDFMSNVFGQSFEIIWTDKIPEARENTKAIGRHLNGCRIGFDAGGSDRKVSAVIDGETVYSEEVVWFPKEHADPDYHYEGIVSALKSAAAHLPHIDAVGVSSAGIYINNYTRSASLFLKVPEDLFDTKVRDIYIRAIRDTFGDVPFEIANDGDVSALAGAMSLGKNNILGIAMGTSEAAGFVDSQGYVTGWLNELAFVPVDANSEAARDEWSGDIGCGVKYFSQDSVIKLAPQAGILLDTGLSPAEKLKAVQKLMEQDDTRAVKIYESIGIYLGHALAEYYRFYQFEHVLLLGRVMSGKGGNLILKTAKEVLTEEYPELDGKIVLSLPDEKFRRVGQSMAAASLPESL